MVICPLDYGHNQWLPPVHSTSPHYTPAFGLRWAFSEGFGTGHRPYPRSLKRKQKADHYLAFFFSAPENRGYAEPTGRRAGVHGSHHDLTVLEVVLIQSYHLGVGSDFNESF